MLDWMKRLLKKEDVHEDASHVEENIYEEKQVLEPMGGKFRFPVIPDEKPKPTAPSVTEKREEKVEVIPKQKENKIVRPVSIKNEQTIQPEKSRQPFRPSEMVSPVFGYERPKQQEEPKKQQEPDLILSEKYVSVVDAWLIKNGYIDEQHVSLAPVEKALPVLEESEAVEEKTLPVLEESEAVEEKTLPVLEESEAVEEKALPVLEESEAVEEKALPVLEESEAVEEKTLPVLEESEAVEEKTLPVLEEFEAVEEKTLPVLEESEAVEEKALPVLEESEVVEEKTLPVLEESEVVEEKALPVLEESEAVEEKALPVLEEFEVVEEKALPVLEEFEAVEEKALPVLEESELVVAEQQAVARREKKRHIPYNVFMLNQDRKRMMARQVAVRTSQSTPEKTEAFVNPDIQPMLGESMPTPVGGEVKERPTQPVSEEGKERVYAKPSLSLLSVPSLPATDDREWVEEQRDLLNTTFENFHVGAKVVHVTQGPAVTRFEVQPEPGVKVNKITNLSDDIKLNLAARDIRIEAPIPGKNAVGIEVPNRTSKAVYLQEILESPIFIESESPLTVALGLDISGAPIVTDLRKMPHGLIAGSTGSGKSVCINAILTSILYKAEPHEVKLLLIDPKMVELAPYNAVPHLISPVVTDVKAATAALKWAVDEMERRYELFSHAGARDLTRYNDLAKDDLGKQLPYIVVVIDELADLMMVAPADVEEAICRIAQKARACGIHLLVATQRPSVDVITGLIKANIPTRIAFTVSSQIDSRTIIDMAGAEKLLGRGDMLFLENGTGKPVRVQGVYVSDDEIERTVYHVKQERKPDYMFQQEDLLLKVEQNETEDELFLEACQFVLSQGGASASALQRKFRVGYNRAARLIEDMEVQGIISQARGTKPRDVLITEDELASMYELV